LRQIEQTVQERAKLLSLDMTGPDAPDAMRTLVREALDHWHAEYQRGRRSVDVAEPEVAAERALRNLTGYGPLQPLLDDPDVWEIMIMVSATCCNPHTPRSQARVGDRQ
jgi:Flp pilus assembly CpaF family ATPase